VSQWEEDCIRYRGKILTGKKAHWCHDWDGLPVDETTKEFECCGCYGGGSMPDEIKSAVGAVRNWGPPSGQVLADEVERLREVLSKIRFYAGEGQWVPCGQCTAAAETIVSMCDEGLRGEDA